MTCQTCENGIGQTTVYVGPPLFFIQQPCPKCGGAGCFCSSCYKRGGDCTCPPPEKED